MSDTTIRVVFELDSADRRVYIKTETSSGGWHRKHLSAERLLNLAADAIALAAMTSDGAPLGLELQGARLAVLRRLETAFNNLDPDDDDPESLHGLEVIDVIPAENDDAKKLYSARCRCGYKTRNYTRRANAANALEFHVGEALEAAK